MTERTVRVSLTAQVTGYLQGMEKARKATADAGTAAEKAAREIEAQNQQMQSAGRGLMAVGVVAVAATALSVKAAIGWESAWAGVTKTVEGTPEELAKVEEGLRSLAKTLPSSHDEIAAVAEAAGQLGIKTGSVTAFTRTMIDLGETTNLSASEAATSLARFMKVMGTAQGDVDRLGSVIVALGNNYATTEAEIVNMSMRLAGAGRQIGLSEGEVLGLSTALSSVGIEAEAGGSAFSKVMIDIAASVDEGGDRLGQFSKVAGVSAQEFTSQWKTDPGAALALFVDGLANAEAQGGSTLGVLEDLGITEVRMRDALLRSASASDEFTAAMADGNKAFDENNALTAEAEKRYATVESQLGIMTNRVSDAAISFGQVFLPAVSAAAEGVGDMADALGAMDPVTQKVIAGAALLGGGIALTGGIFLLALPKIAAFQVSLGILATSSMPAVAAAATGMMTATTRATTAMGAASKFMMGPWGLAIMAAVTGVALLTRTMDANKASSEEIANSLKTAAAGADAFNIAARGIKTSWLLDATKEFEDLSGVLEVGADRAESFIGWMNTDLNEHAALGVIGDVGIELANLAATDLPAAQAGFQGLVEKYKLTEKEQYRLLGAMPEYKDALVAQASALDINVTSSDEAANKTALLKLAQEQATPVALTAAEAYLETADQAASLDDEIITLMESMNALNQVGQDASGANLTYQQSLLDVQDRIDKINAGTEGYAKTLDITTQAGIDNRTELDSLAASNQAAAAAQFELDGNTANYKATLEKGHQAVIDNAIALGANADEANRIADEIAGIPDESEWKVIADTAEAEARFGAVLAKYDGKTINMRLFLDSSGGDRGLAASAARLTAEALARAQNQADGGEVYGVGGPRQDNIPIMASAGEHMFDAEDVKAMGGQSAVYNFRAGLHSGRSGFADGGSIGRYASPVQYVAAPSSSGGGSPVNVSPRVSLAGATFAMTVDGRQMTAVIQEQIVSADSNKARGIKMGQQR